MALEEIDGWRNAYKNYTDEQLIEVMHEKVSHCAQHIAAKQIFESRRFETIRHGNSIQKETKNLTHWILWLTVAILLLTIFQVFSPIFRVKEFHESNHAVEQPATKPDLNQADDE